MESSTQLFRQPIIDQCQIDILMTTGLSKMHIDIADMYGLRRFSTVETQVPMRAADARSYQEYTQQSEKPLGPTQYEHGQSLAQAAGGDNDRCSRCEIIQHDDSHEQRHHALVHTHAHFPDVHHRHSY